MQPAAVGGRRFATVAHKIAAMLLALLATLVFSPAAQASSGLEVTITSISPSSGSTAGGTTVTITGQNLGVMPTVRFDGVAASSYTSKSSTQLVVTTPAHAAGTVDVSVVTLDGSTTSTGGFTYVAPEKPDVTRNSVNVPYNAVDFEIPLLLSGGPADYVTVTDAPTYGVATASGTTITFTPSRDRAGTDGFAYNATNAQGTSKKAIVTILIDPPTPVLTPGAGALPAGKIGDAYAQSITASGGKSPYTYSIKSGALPAGISLDAATGAISGTPTVAGKADFTFEVKDGFAMKASGNYSIDVVPLPPIVSSVSPATGDAAGGTAVTISGQHFSNATSVTFGGAAASTVTVVNDTTITATTPAHAAGTVDVVVTTAGDPGTLADGFTFTVSPPVANAVSATVAANSSANPITLNVTGGAPDSVTVVSLASHGTATASGATITYTPTAGYSGSDSFTYTATNVSGTSTAATVTITVSAPTFVFAPAAGSLRDGKVDEAYNQTLTASAGTAPYSYAVTSGALPAGLDIDPATGTISGTPSAAGEVSFTVTATDAYSATGSVAYSIDINGVLVFTPAGGALPDAMAGEDYNATASAGGATGAVLYEISSGALPDGMVLNVSTGALSGPLAANATLGSYNFTVTATDSTGATGAASYTLEVVEQDITAADKEVTVPAGSTPNNVYLNRDATGAPFTGAAVAYVNPPNAGTAEIILGEVAALGGFVPVGYYLKFTPNRAYSGTAMVGYTLTSAFGTSNTGTVTYHIAVDADEVASDIDNMVHGFVRSRQNLLSSTIELPGLMERRRAASAGEAVTTAVSPSADGANASFSTSLAQVKAARQQADAEAGETVVPDLSPFNVWANGAFLLHNREENGNNWGSFALFSSGADYLLNDKALVGLSFHYDRMSDPTDEDAKLTGNGWLVGPYASFEIGQGVFLDTSLLYGGSANDIDTRFYDGKFDTRRWMSYTSLKGQWLLDDVTTLTPKLRAVYLNERVDDYDVSNGTTTVALKSFSEEQLRLSAGFDLQRAYDLENGLLLTPSAGMNVGFSAMDGNGAFGSLAAGLTFSNDINWDVDLSLLVNIEGDGQKSAGGKLGVAGRF